MLATLTSVIQLAALALSLLALGKVIMQNKQQDE